MITVCYWNWIYGAVKLKEYWALNTTLNIPNRPQAISPAVAFFVHLSIVLFVQTLLLHLHLLLPLRRHWKSRARSWTHSWFKCNEMDVMSLALALSPSGLPSNPWPPESTAFDSEASVASSAVIFNPFRSHRLFQDVPSILGWTQAFTRAFYWAAK